MKHGIIARPHIDDAEIGVGIEALGEFLPLMEHVALESVTDLIPGEHFFFVHKVPARAALEGVEMYEGFVRDHAGQREPDAGGFRIIVIAAVEVLVVFDSKDLLEENESVKNSGFEAAGDGDDAVNFVWVTCRESQGAESADRRSNNRVEFADFEVIEQRKLRVDKIGNVKMRECGTEGFTGFKVDARGSC